MNKKRETGIFLILAFALFAYFGLFHTFSLGPFGMHQGAQADRASIALNYFEHSMNFFQPRVMENRSYHGITGMEFPIVSYLTAIFYQLFGFSHIFYRLVEALLFLGGQYAFWKLTQFFIPKITHRILFHTLWVSSPILIFYSNNFLPEVPALSLSLMAWYQLFRYYYQIEQNKSLRYFILFSTLAALIKITYLIPIIALVIILLLHKKLPFSPFPNQRKLLWATTIPFICVFAWYYYARILTDITYNIHFLQQINPPLSFAEFWENTRYALNTWIDSVYPRQFVILLELVWFYTLQRKFKQLRLSGAISILLFGGFLAIFILFNRQFRYHDYYFISAIPALMFQMLYLYEEHLAQRQLFSGLVGILTLIGLFISPFIHANHTQKQVKATYTPGDYYCQNLINNTEDFNKAKAFIDRELGPGEIIVAFDPSPNTMLYYLQRQGIRLAPDFEEILSIGIIQSKLDENILAKPYICVNNYFDLPKEHYIQDIIEVKPIFQTGDLWIFKLRKDRFNF